MIAYPMAMQTQPQSAGDHRFQFILWLAMVGSILLYFVVANLVVPAAAPSDNPEIVTGLLIFALLLTAGSVPVRSHLFAEEDGKLTPQQKRQSLVVALSMCEAAAIFGIIARFAFGSPSYYLFFLIGLAGQLLHYPRQKS